MNDLAAAITGGGVGFGACQGAPLPLPHPLLQLRVLVKVPLAVHGALLLPPATLLLGAATSAGSSAGSDAGAAISPQGRPHLWQLWPLQLWPRVLQLWPL